MATSEDYDSYTTHPLADLCECAIHMGLLQQPKLLHCGHSFCLDCLQKIHNTEVTKCLYPSSEVRCPTCTQQHQLPTGGIPKLPVDFKSNQLIEIITRETKQQLDVAAKESHTVGLEAEDDFKRCTICKEEGQNVTGVQYCISCSNVMCDNCLVIHDREMKQHVNVPLEYDKVICKTHKTRFVNRYCLQCSTPVCMLCIMRGHSQHESVEFIRSYPTKHEQIQALRERLSQTENSLQTKLKSITATKVKNSSDYSRTKQDITSCISRLQAQLEREQKQMIAQLDNYHSASSKQISSSEVRIRELLKSVSDTTLQLHQVEYPLGIDTVTLTRHLPITLHLETSADIEQCMSTVMEQYPCYNYSAGSASSGSLTTSDFLTDAKSMNTAEFIKQYQQRNKHDPVITATKPISPLENREEVCSESFPLEYAIIQFIITYCHKKFETIMKGRNIHTGKSDENGFIDVWCVSHKKDDAERYFQKFVDYYQDMHELLWTEELDVAESHVHVLCEYLNRRVPCILGHLANGKLRVTCEKESKNDILAIIDNICAIKENPDHMKHSKVSHTQESKSTTKSDDISSHLVHQNDLDEHDHNSFSTNTQQSESTTKTDDMSSSSVHQNAPNDLKEHGRKSYISQESESTTNTNDMSSSSINKNDPNDRKEQRHKSSEKTNTSGARPKNTGYDIKREHIIVNPLYWKYIETHECGFLLKLKEQLAFTHVELETDWNKLILVGKQLSSLSVMKKYLQQNYEGFAFNLKSMPMASTTGRLNISDLCLKFPDVAFVQDDSGEINVVGLEDNIDVCIMTLARNTQAEKHATQMDVENTQTTDNRRFSDNMELPQPTTKYKQTNTFPVEKDLLHFLKLHHQDDLRKVKDIYELRCTESSDPDYCVNVWFADRSGNPSQKQLTKFIQFYQDVYTTIAQDTLSSGPAAAERIESMLRAMEVPCLLTEISTGTFKATYYSEQEQVVRDVVQQILKSTGAPSVKETSFHSSVSSGPLTVRLPPETASNTVTAGTGSRHATPYRHHPSGFIIHNKIEVFIHKCDITKLHVDAVVNAANNSLHHGGGVARAISKAAGPELDKEGRYFVNKHGKLAESMVAVTTGGNMPCEKVIHAVGPQWHKWPDQHKEQRCLTLLYATFNNILDESNKCGFRSLAMPAVSSGNTPINTIVYIPIIYELNFFQILD